MIFDPPLVRGRLLQRYKRFLADVVLDDGSELTAHCPNPGAMLGLNQPGMTVWLSRSPDPKRKLAYTLELVEPADDAGGATTIVGVNTMHPNRLTAEALAAGAIPEVAGYATVRREVKYGTNSRVDFLLEDPSTEPTWAPPRSANLKPDHRVWLEVKNCHLMRSPGLAEFPDCVAARSLKHLRELEEMVAEGDRAVVLFIVQRTDCAAFSACHDLDPAFAKGLDRAADAGVEVLVYACDVAPSGVKVARRIEWRR